MVANSNDRLNIFQPTTNCYAVQYFRKGGSFHHIDRFIVNPGMIMPYPSDSDVVMGAMYRCFRVLPFEASRGRSCRVFILSRMKSDTLKSRFCIHYY